MLDKLSALVHWRARAWLILTLLAVSAICLTLTLPPLQEALGGWIEALDAQLFYTAQDALRTVASYGKAAPLWIRIYLTWDVANPILYTSVFSLLISWLFQRGFWPGSQLQMLSLLPAGAGLFDLLENLSIVTLLAAYPARPVAVAWFATICTMAKVGFLGLTRCWRWLGWWRRR